MKCRPDRWLLGLPVLAAIGLGSAVWDVPAIEADLRRGAAAAMDAAPGSRPGGFRLAVAGRDVQVVGETESPAEARDAVLRRLAAAPGLRRVVFAVEEPRPASPYTFAATRRGDAVLLSGHVVPGPLRDALGILVRERVAGAALEDESRTATGEPPGFDVAARYAVAFATALTVARADLDGTGIRLDGSARDEREYAAAMALVRDPPPGFAIAASAIEPPLARPFAWSASKEGGRLVLAGHVPSEADRAALAAGREGTAVVDGMRTARGLDPAVAFQPMARAGLAWLDRLESGRMRLDGAALAVEGRTPARDLLPVLERDLRAALPSGLSIGAIDLKAVPASPYRFAARRGEGRLVLSGYLPQEADRAVILAAAGRRFPFESIVNEVRLADGAPPATADVAELALARLSSFAEGEAGLSDRTFRLAGRILYPEAAERARRDFGGGLPEGWTATVAVASAPDRPLEAGLCTDLLEDSLRREPVRFEPGRAEPNAAGRKAVASLAAVLRRCSGGAVRVVSLLESAGDAAAAADLSRRRADAVAALLAGAGAGTLRPEGLVRKPAEPPGSAERISVEVQP